MTVRMLVPAYFSPAGNGLKDWNKLIDAARSISVIAIANPGDGPGDSPDASYSQIIARATDAGVVIIGYVSTSYGQRSADAIRADVDRWVSYYPQTAGIFFDEQASGDGEVNDYRELFLYARGKIAQSLIVGNPGVVPSERYLSEAGADIECIFESDKGFDNFQPPPWAASYTADRFCALLLRVSGTSSMKKKVQKAVGQNIGNTYVTNDKLPNPWDRLPSYWEKEVALLEELSQ